MMSNDKYVRAWPMCDASYTTANDTQRSQVTRAMSHTRKQCRSKAGRHRRSPGSFVVTEIGIGATQVGKHSPVGPHMYHDTCLPCFGMNKSFWNVRLFETFNPVGAQAFVIAVANTSRRHTERKPVRNDFDSSGFAHGGCRFVVADDDDDVISTLDSFARDSLFRTGSCCAANQFHSSKPANAASKSPLNASSAAMHSLSSLSPSMRMYSSCDANRTRASLVRRASSADARTASAISRCSRCSSVCNRRQRTRSRCITYFSHRCSECGHSLQELRHCRTWCTHTSIIATALTYTHKYMQ
jgi:hypothetical protein